jgi:hypothetical protein
VRFDALVSGRHGPAGKKEKLMRFMLLVPGDERSEAGVMPGPEGFEAMNRYNEELVKAGVLLATDGLHPTSKGARIRFAEGGHSAVIDGPFTESKELIAGYWIIQVHSKEEAIEWARRAPFEPGFEMEVRQVFDADDFGDAIPAEVRDAEARMSAHVAEQHNE